MKKIHQFKFKKAINLYCFTDIHIGAVEHEEALFKKAIDKLIKDKDGYCFFNGDNLEVIPHGYKISQRGQNLSITEQFSIFFTLLNKLGDKTLFWRFGNHEERIRRVTDLDIAALIQVKAPQLFVGMEEVHIKINNSLTRLVSSHGEGGGSKKILNNMKLTYPGADVYFSGHTHELFENSSNRYVDTTSGSKILKNQIQIVGGSFVGEAEYAAERNMIPTQPGCFVLHIAEEGVTIKEKIV